MMMIFNEAKTATPPADHLVPSHVNLASPMQRNEPNTTDVSHITGIIVFGAAV